MKFIRISTPKKSFRKVIVLNKKEGQTPLECLEVFRAENDEYKNLKMTYAGRLDPMASGLLLILAGEETKNKEKYLKLGKEYKFEVLFGFRTDTYDILGKVFKTGFSQIQNFRGPRKGVSQTVENLVSLKIQKLLQENLKHFTGKFVQKYPMYSSKTVKGKPLFSYARKGEEIEAPKSIVNVESLKLLKIRKINNQKLLENIEKRIKRVNGDFRQDEILKIWRKKLEKEKTFHIVSFKIKCGSGTYVRGIANSLGERVKIPALAYSIKRTRVGKYMI